MRKSMLFFVITAFCFACQEEIDIAKEKEAIITVIEEESDAFFARDYDRFSACYVQNESTIRLDAGKEEYWFVVGWNEIDSIFRTFFEKNSEPRENFQVKTNYKINVYDRSAFAVFDNEIHNSTGDLLRTNVHCEFLEKVNGTWKIVYLSEIHTSTYQ
jgi:hypothetical protein